MRVLVTGARGKVGTATVAALLEAGHDVRATDLTPPVFERPEEGEADYYQADLTDAGDAFAVVRGAEAVVHTAAARAFEVVDDAGKSLCSRLRDLNFAFSGRPRVSYVTLPIRKWSALRKVHTSRPGMWCPIARKV